MANNVPETRIKGGTIIGLVEEKPISQPKPVEEPKPKKSAK